MNDGSETDGRSLSRDHMGQLANRSENALDSILDESLGTQKSVGVMDNLIDNCYLFLEDVSDGEQDIEEERHKESPGTSILPEKPELEKPELEKPELEKPELEKPELEEFYLRRKEKTLGPFSVAAIKKNIDLGRLLRSDGLSSSDSGPWKTLDESIFSVCFPEEQI